jgi:bifunctional DNA-binding transcriptional regulator/antitoxin component of YhaV-PrlF toxin-antitoxin module
MAAVVTMNARGTLTLPMKIRKRFGMDKGGALVAEETDGGILLRPGQFFPVEVYTDERIEEFDAEDRKLAAVLRRRKAKSG